MYRISDIQVGDYWYSNYKIYNIDKETGKIIERNSSTKIIVYDKKISNNLKGNYILSLKLIHNSVLEEFCSAILNEECRILKVIEPTEPNTTNVSFTTNQICKNNKLRFNYLDANNFSYVADYTFYKKQ